MKNKMSKLIFVLFVGTAVLISLPLMASAQTDKLVIEDDVGNPVFSVDSQGQVRASVSSFISGDTFMTQTMYPYSDVGWQGGFFGVSRAKGTEASPLPVTANNTIFTFDAMGWVGRASGDGRVHGAGVQDGRPRDARRAVGIAPGDI